MGDFVSCPLRVAPNDDDDTECFRCGTALGRIVGCPSCRLDVLAHKLICPRCDTVLHPHTDDWGNEWKAGDATR